MPLQNYDKILAPGWRPWTALSVALCLTLLLGLFLLSRSYERLTRDQSSRLQTQALVVSENISRQLRSMDNALRAVRTDLETEGGASRDLFRQLKTLSDVMPGLKGLLATDVGGTVGLASFTKLLGQDVSERDYFSIPRQRPDFTALYVSSPFLSRQGNYSINLTKAVADRNGQFAGVVTANLEPGYFEILARSVLFAPDMRVRLVHGDGRVFVDARHAVDALGTDVGEHGSLFSQHVRSEKEESVMLSAFRLGTGGNMMVYRTILLPELNMDTPLVVSVSRESDAIYAVWWGDVRTSCAIFLLLCLGSAGALRLAQLRNATALQAFRELTDAAELQQRTGKLAKVGGWQFELATMRMTWTEEMFDIHALPQTARPSMELLLDSICPESRQLLELAIQRAMMNGAPWSIEARVATTSEANMWVRTHGQAVVRNGKIVQLRGASQNITERVEYAAKLASAYEKLKVLAITDELTGVGNRRRFDQQLQAEWSRCQRRELPLGMLMLDIDHFKRYNDSYGHPGGDEVLRKVSAIILDCAQRSGEIVARYGGEEFAVLLPGSDSAGARKVALDILAKLKAARIPHDSSPTSTFLTVSIGIASTVPTPADEPLNLVKKADTALYVAKTLGRDRVEEAEDHVHAG